MDEKLSAEAERFFPDPASFLARVQKKYSRLIVELKRLPQPIIAVVQGAAAGGGLCMALASDVIYAGPKAKFIPSFINIGLSGGELGTSYFLPRMIGSVRAAEILMTGRAVLADEAERIGLINRMVDEESLLKTAYDTARIMLTKSVPGLKQTKEILTHNLNAPSLDTAIEFENRNQSICAFSRDLKRQWKLLSLVKKPDQGWRIQLQRLHLKKTERENFGSQTEGEAKHRVRPCRGNQFPPVHDRMNYSAFFNLMVIALNLSGHSRVSSFPWDQGYLPPNCSTLKLGKIS